MLYIVQYVGANIIGDFFVKISKNKDEDSLVANIQGVSKKRVIWVSGLF